MRHQKETENKTQLIFHPKWEKALSIQDRKLIHQLVEQHGAPPVNQLNIIPIRAGLNYKGELFVTVIMQNGRNQDLHFTPREVSFSDHVGNQMSQLFDLPDLVLQEQSSTPWTFIFEQHPYGQEEQEWSSWELQIRQESAEESKG